MLPLDTVFPELGFPLADALLAPHRSYLPALLAALALQPRRSKPWRTLPAAVLSKISRACCRMGCAPCIEPELAGPAAVPPDPIARAGGSAEEMYRVFNMGIGMVLLSPAELDICQVAVPNRSG
jgi:phosphoribosylaminoimidazole (AIR) synthetase